MIEELKLPEGVTSATYSKELIRIWLTDDQQTVVLEGTVWEDPAAWGILLVDLMRHIANAYSYEGVQDFEAAFDRIKMGLNAEMTSYTS